MWLRSVHIIFSHFNVVILYMVWECSEVWFSSMKQSNFTNTFYWQDYCPPHWLFLASMSNINWPYISSVHFSRSVVSNSSRPHELQHTRPPCPSPLPGVYSNSCPSSRWCHPAISSSVVPFSSCPNPSQHQGLLQWVNSLHEVAKVLEFQLQHQSFQWTPRTDLL